MNANEIREKINALESNVYEKMVYNAKNACDPEVEIPICKKENMQLKKVYNLEGRDDTKANKKRREKRLGKLEENIVSGRIDEVKEMILSYYYMSITGVSKHNEWKCNEKTARKLLNCLFTMIGYKNVDRIPKTLLNDAVTLANKWLDYTKTLYKCCKSPEKALNFMGEEEMLLTYDVYLLAKTMMLIECNNETDYYEKTAMLHKNKKLRAIYAAARELKGGEECK